MSEETLALLKSGPRRSDTGVARVPRRSPGADEVLLDVLGCGVCGSDVHAWRGDEGYDWVVTPVVLGHEVVGRVADVGSGGDPALIGRLVVPVSIDGCHTCATCLSGSPQVCERRRQLGFVFDGGAAEQLVVERSRVITVPEGIPALRAALTEPLSVAAHAVSLLGDVRDGLPVVVSGPGPIGLFSAWLLARLGHDVVVTGTERDEEVRLPAARALGLRTVRADLGQLPDRAGAWVEASGSAAAIQDALDTLAPGTRMVVVALFGAMPTIDINQAVRNQIEIVGSYASVAADYETALAALADADGLEDLVVTEVPLDRAVEALEATAAGEVVKAVIVP